MKRSAKVGLTLLVPAMAAFGCGQPAIPVVGNNQPVLDGQNAVDCDVPAKPGEPDKPKCTKPASSARNGAYHHHRSYWYNPWSWGGRSYLHSAPTRITPTTSHTGPTTTHSSGTGGVHSGSTTHGGFGGTGSHLSGGT